MCCGHRSLLAKSGGYPRAVDSGGVIGATTRIRTAVVASFYRAPQLCHEDDRTRDYLIEIGESDPPRIDAFFLLLNRINKRSAATAR